MGRTTISLPDDLIERMDRAKESGASVNWSAEAARAFEVRLAAIVAAEPDPSLDDVIARLRTAKARAAEAIPAPAPPDDVAGRRAGIRWAKTRAEPAQLANLEALVTGDWETFKGADPNEARTFPARLADAIHHSLGDRFPKGLLAEIGPFGMGYRMGSRSDHPIASGNVSNEFVDAFARGALEVWRAVKDRV